MRVMSIIIESEVILREKNELKIGNKILKYTFFQGIVKIQCRYNAFNRFRKFQMTIRICRDR